MSANNQTLIKEYKGKFYVFSNVMAESWFDSDDSNNKGNILSIKEATGVYDTRDEAYKVALKIDEEWGQFQEGTEYGIVFDKLQKDNAPVEIVEDLELK